jgi:hypothetical protein
MAVGLDIDFAPGMSLEQMLHRCGAYGWELVAVGHDDQGEVFYFKKTRLNPSVNSELDHPQKNRPARRIGVGPCDRMSSGTVAVGSGFDSANSLRVG